MNLLDYGKKSILNFGIIFACTISISIKLEERTMSKSHNTNRATIISRPTVHRTDISNQDVKLINEENKYDSKIKPGKLEKRKEAEFKEEETKANDNKTEDEGTIINDTTAAKPKPERGDYKDEDEELKESYEMDNRKAVDGTADDINNVGGELNKRNTF